MAEQNLNETAVNAAGMEEVNSMQAFTFQDIMEIGFRKWYWFLSSVILFLIAGSVYLMWTPPVYQRNATIMVKDSRKGSGATEVAAFSELAGLSSRRNVDNELYVLQARRLMLSVVDKLNLSINHAERSAHNRPLQAFANQRNIRKRQRELFVVRFPRQIAGRSSRNIALCTRQAEGRGSKSG